jgi:polysaccharide export outer membrane protein
MALALMFTMGAAGPASLWAQSNEIPASMLKDRIAPGDVLNINMNPGEEYSRVVTVQPDGTIQMPMIGAFAVRGMSIEELQDYLHKKYSRFLSNPQVTVNTQKFSGRRVSIIGEIKAPGFYDYRDGMRLLELVSLAGGLGPDARSTRIEILRLSPTRKSASFSVNFQAVLDGDLARDTLLAPGDTINVPKKPLSDQSAWVQRNVLPWAILVSMFATIIVATRK